MAKVAGVARVAGFRLQGTRPLALLKARERLDAVGTHPPTQPQGKCATAHLDARHVAVKAVAADPDAVRGREEVDRHGLARDGPRVGPQRNGLGRRGGRRAGGDPAALDRAMPPVAKARPFGPVSWRPVIEGAAQPRERMAETHNTARLFPKPSQQEFILRPITAAWRGQDRGRPPASRP